MSTAPLAAPLQQEGLAALQHLLFNLERAAGQLADPEELLLKSGSIRNERFAADVLVQEKELSNRGKKISYSCCSGTQIAFSSKNQKNQGEKLILTSTGRNFI